MPDLKKAELIEGVVYMPSPVRLRRHGGPHADIIGWLTCYRAATPGVIVADNATARLGLENVAQPDALLMIAPEFGGKARISDDDYVEGAPELVVEVASSSVSLDLNLKFHVYRRSGVLEYVVWQVQDRVIDWFVLRDGEFVRLEPDGQGIYRSLVFPGLWLDATAMLGGELAKVLSVLNEGLASPDHDRFSKSLKEAHPSAQG
jgi:Uma2 family endonuclease